jgi:membrane associated rhomboid family serine protease
MSITLAIILITALVSFPAFNNEKLRNDLLFWPYMVERYQQHYRFITGGVVHADLFHLAFNMISLYSFGMALEQSLFPAVFGEKSKVLYGFLYISSIVFASLHDFIKHRNDQGYRALGASGAVSAVIFSAIVIVPGMPIRFFFFPIDIPGYLFGFVFLGFSYYFAKKGGGNIGHNAHFWGAVYGVVFTLIAGRAFSHLDLLKRFLMEVF